MKAPPARRPPYAALDAPVVANARVADGEYEMVLHAPPVAQTARPGQFVEILSEEDATPSVRRPFSLFRVDRADGTCSLLYRARGTFTSHLAQKQTGETVSLLGPLGKPFAWPSDPETRHILIGGGIGVPPLYFLASEMCQERIARGLDTHNILAVIGARTAELLVGMVEFGRLDIVLHALTDDGTRGTRGLVTDLLVDLLDHQAQEDSPVPTHLYACGPMPMLEAIAGIALARDLPCQVSVETPMPCGIGTCGECAIPVYDPVRKGKITTALACMDGPVFEARALAWDRIV
ncbi:MAG TPA: dihydroorotate dehydrogenase electron transfer subunit [Chthonomonadaceae bacterium]|nr:dihydroorotate dehydrogenase electron transfer subunit [Chthonomonadaceae bacterium]